MGLEMCINDKCMGQDTVIVLVGDRLRLAPVPSPPALSSLPASTSPSLSPFLFAPNPAPSPALLLPLQWRIITGLCSEGRKRREGESAADTATVVVVVENLQSVSSFRRGETCSTIPSPSD